MLAAVRAVNRLESVGETLRAALNALATVTPAWLAQHADAEWPDRYGRPFEEWRLPKGERPRKVLGEQICGLYRSRYVGLAKTHLQHVATAAALNVARLDA